VSSERYNSSGYALILAAVVVAMLALVLLTVARVQGDVSPGLRAMRLEAAHEAAAQSAAARIAFLLLTEAIGPRSVVIGGPREPGAAAGPMRGRGGRELRLDGRFYAVGDTPNVFASVQDENGLLSLNAGDDAALARLLEQLGLANAQSLAGALGDYVDEDDLTRLYGAEEDVYRRARLATPPNQALANRWSALGALNWRTALSEEQKRQLWRNVSVSPRGAGLNVNTAPLTVLTAVIGNARSARAIVARREQAELRSLDDIEGLTGINTRADGVVLATRPAAAFRLVIVVGRGGRGYESQLVLADPNAVRPMYWRGGRLAAAMHGRDDFESAESLPEQAFAP